jgi:hypothetical protein
MNRSNTSSVFRILAFLTIIISGMFISSCESSRIGPTVPTPNPESPTPPALLITGNVVDSKAGSTVTSANVSISKQDGTAIATVVTDNTGAFSYDISNVNQSVLKVAASATGFGSSFVYANVDLTNRSVNYISVPIDKLTATAVTLTSSGGSTTLSSTESKTSQPLTITVPQGSVTTNTSLQVMQVPVNNVPPPTNAGNTTQVGIASLLPAGITFAKPVTLSFPLPYQFKAGDQIQLNSLTTNNTWQNTNLTATVDNSGYIANVNITQTNQYSLLDNTSITGSVTSSLVSSKDNLDSKVLLKTSEILDTRSVTLTGSTTTTSLPVTATLAITFSNVQTSEAGFQWLLDVLQQTYGNLFLKFTGNGSVNYNVQKVLNWPSTSNPNALNQSTGQGNLQYPNDTGSWSVVFNLASSTNTWCDLTIRSAYWTAHVVGTTTAWSISSRNWVWTGHNQGTVSYTF